MMFHINSIKGNSGSIEVASVRGAVCGTINNWYTVRSGDSGKLGLRAFFSWHNPTIMKSENIGKRVFLHIRKDDIVELTWESWSFDGNQLILEGITNVPKQPQA
jgi:hypothetical protein